MLVAQELVERHHPLRVAAGQVVVDRHHVHAFAQQRVGVRRQRGDQRLALAGLHLGDLTLVQDLAAHDLDVEVTHAHDAFAGLAADREHLGQHVVERLARGDALPELGRLGLQLGVGELGDLRFEGVGGDDGPAEPGHFALVGVEDRLQKRHTER